MIKNSSLVTNNSLLSLRAPAKINWFLTVLGKREDGFHDIMSLIQCVNLYDELIFEHADIIEVISDLDIPLEDNLVYKAASLLKQYTSYRGGARITLKKNIPVSAGLGGGSSDAAYTLSGLNILWGLDLSNGELSSIGIEIGSDVPFFLNGPFAFVEGRGENIIPLKLSTSVVLLLVKPMISVSTAWAYASFDKAFGPSSGRGLRMRGEPVEWFDRLNIGKLTKKPVDIKLFCQAIKKQDFASLSIILNNDLERVVVEKYPVVGEIKDRMLGKGAVISAMSGSGPTVFGIFELKKAAFAVAEEMGSANWCKVVETLI